jgi:hypothetical protein
VVSASLRTESRQALRPVAVTSGALRQLASDSPTCRRAARQAGPQACSDRSDGRQAETEAPVARGPGAQVARPEARRGRGRMSARRQRHRVCAVCPGSRRSWLALRHQRAGWCHSRSVRSLAARRCAQPAAPGCPSRRARERKALYVR